MGTILPYVGDIKDIPKGWALCDGTNGTPDLTGRFLEGTIANPKEFKEAGIPNIIGNSGIGFFATGVDYSTLGSGAIRSPYVTIGRWHGQSDTTSYHSITFNASLFSSIYRNDITTVQPASYTVMYIMKIKK